MDIFLTWIMISLGTVSLVLGIINIIQEDKRIAANWRSIYLVGVFGVIVSANMLFGIWLNIPSRLRQFINTYIFAGALISYPLLRVPEACLFIRTDFGMSYTPPNIFRVWKFMSFILELMHC